MGDPAATPRASARRISVGIDGTTWNNDRGFGRFTRATVAALAASDSEFDYTLLTDESPESPLPESVRRLYVATSSSLTAAASGSGSRSVANVWALSRAAARGRFDVFFFPAVYSFFPILSRVPIAVAFHDATAERYPELIFPSRHNRWLWRSKVALARLQAHRIVTVSRSAARDVEDLLGVARDRIDVVFEAADPRFRRLDDARGTEAARARCGVAAEVPMLLCVGGLNPHKNLAGLLRGLASALASLPDVHLVIVGDISGRGFYDNVDELQRIVRCDSQLRARVHFTGRVSDEELVLLYNGATALVFPSLSEGFGLPAVEAMACGLPVLASRAGSLPETIGDAGLFFDPESSQEMCDAILRLLGDSGLRAELAARASRRARQFSWDRTAQDLEATFRACLDPHRGSS